MKGITELLAHSPDAMFVVEGNHTIAAANDAACSLFGYGKGELDGCALDKVVPASSRQGQATSWDPADAANPARIEPQRRDVLALRKDGSRLSVEIALRRIAGNAVGRMVASFHDVTRRLDTQAESTRQNEALERRAEERTWELAERAAQLEERTRQLEQRTLQLEQANRELEAFSYSVSHDLRAPLRAISGFARILAQEHRDGLNEDGRRYLDNIVRASGHMGRLIDELLGYGRMGRQAIARKPVPLGTKLAEIARLLQPRADECGAELVIAGDLPVVLGDETLLTRVFTNLLDNALTYRKAGTPARIAVTWKRMNGHAVVSVADNGIGIASEHFDGIFMMFQRLHRQEEYPGTGIGLAVVKKALELQGGCVRVESRVGEGTTFHVRLPLAAAGTAPTNQNGTLCHSTARSDPRLIVGEDES